MTDLFKKKSNFTESSFEKKIHLAEKKLRRRSFDQTFISPKTFSENGHKTGSSFDRNLFSENGHLTERSFERMFF
jgi:hypothetical protein